MERDEERRLEAGHPRLRLVVPEPKREAPAVRPTVGPSWSAEPATSSRSAPTAVVPEEQLDARLDEVLAKIARDGGKSGLTEEEHYILQEASRRARDRRSGPSLR